MGGRWLVPATGLALGALLCVAAVAGGDPGLGLSIFAVMAVYSGFLLWFGTRSEAVGILAGRPADERLAGFNLAATAIAGVAAIVVALAGFAWSVANGESGMDFALVAAVAGIAYLAALLWFRWRG